MTETTAKKKLTIEEQIAKAEERTKQLKAKKERIEARQLTALTKGERAQDTRRKILIGAMNLAKLENPERGERARAALIRDLDNYLTRDDDRALFADLLNGQPAASANAEEGQ